MAGESSRRHRRDDGRRAEAPGSSRDEKETRKRPRRGRSASSSSSTSPARDRRSTRDRHDRRSGTSAQKSVDEDDASSKRAKIDHHATSSSSVKNQSGGAQSASAVDKDELIRRTQAMIEQKKREIADRLAAMGRHPPPSLSVQSSSISAGGVQSQQPTSLPTSAMVSGDSSVPLVPKTQFATVGANVRVAQAIESKLARARSHAERKQAEAKGQQMQPDLQLKMDKSAPYYDPYLSGGKFQEMAPARRAPKNALRFIPKGKFVAKANEIRKQAQLDKLREDIALKMKRAGLEGELDLVGEGAIVRETVPQIEWWDTKFFPKTMCYGPTDLPKSMADTVSELIQHPVPIEPAFEQQQAGARPVMLTKRELKKARRLRRLEETKEKQEKIRLGLLPPEEPKLKLSNMVSVFGKEAVMDPTLIEKKVREQMQQRQEEHERRNLERQLTAEERREKNIRKRTEDTSMAVSVAVFRIRDLSHPQQKFKVKVNADQNHLSGLCILYEDCNIVVVEGGPKGVNRYKNLMLKRIDWNHRPVPTSMSFEESEAVRANWVKPNDCALVWEGMNRESQYRGFRFIPCTTDLKVKETLGERCVHYWDLARNYKPVG